VGMAPAVPAGAMPIGVTADASGFITVSDENGGLIPAGCATNALDVNRAVQSATAGALRAIQVINSVAGVEG
ncbi:MAG: heterodisulfide reductase subunit A, partial [Sulfuricella sp.]|nr:heterodisulfide reductase subunit A [Sulfuricella sp.]